MRQVDRDARPDQRQHMQAFAQRSKRGQLPAELDCRDADFLGEDSCRGKRQQE